MSSFTRYWPKELLNSYRKVLLQEKPFKTAPVTEQEVKNLRNSFVSVTRDDPFFAFWQVCACINFLLYTSAQPIQVEPLLRAIREWLDPDVLPALQKIDEKRSLEPLGCLVGAVIDIANEVVNLNGIQGRALRAWDAINRLTEFVNRCRHSSSNTSEGLVGVWVITWLSACTGDLATFAGYLLIMGLRVELLWPPNTDELSPKLAVFGVKLSLSEEEWFRKAEHLFRYLEKTRSVKYQWVHHSQAKFFLAKSCTGSSANNVGPNDRLTNFTEGYQRLCSNVTWLTKLEKTVALPNREMIASHRFWNSSRQAYLLWAFGTLNQPLHEDLTLKGLDKMQLSFDEWLRNRRGALTEDEQVQELLALIPAVGCVAFCSTTAATAATKAPAFGLAKPVIGVLEQLTLFLCPDKFPSPSSYQTLTEAASQAVARIRWLCESVSELQELSKANGMWQESQALGALMAMYAVMQATEAWEDRFWTDYLKACASGFLDDNDTAMSEARTLQRDWRDAVREVENILICIQEVLTRVGAETMFQVLQFLLVAMQHAGESHRYPDIWNYLKAENSYTWHSEDVEDMLRELGNLFVANKQWEHGLTAFQKAIDLTDRYFMKLSGQTRELVNRMVDDPERRLAVFMAAIQPTTGETSSDLFLTLERGRARELKIRTVMASSSRATPPNLQQMGATFSGPTCDHGENWDTRSLEDTLNQLGIAPESFHCDREDLYQAAEPGWPVIYVDVTDYGTLYLVLTHERVDLVEPFTQTSATGSDVAQNADEESGYPSSEGSKGPGSLETSSEQGGEDVMETIDRLFRELTPMQRLIPSQLKQLKAKLEEKDVVVEGLTLIPCGPAVDLPLHAIEDSGVCLLDELPIRYLPCAQLGLTIAKRQAEKEPARPLKFIALSNPTLPAESTSNLSSLDGAKVEAETIKDIIGGESKVYPGDEATLHNLSISLKDTTHLLIAAHGQGDRSNDRVARLFLADGYLPLHRVHVELENLSARLAMLSTCENIVTFEKSPDEAMNFASAIVAAGASCCIGTLWPVNDTAAALCIVKFFELHLGVGTAGDHHTVGEIRNPAIALQQAQIWLKNLPLAGDKEFFAKFPALKTVFRTWIHIGRRADGPQPFRHPMFWAPWMIVGY